MILIWNGKGGVVFVRNNKKGELGLVGGVIWTMEDSAVESWQDSYGGMSADNLKGLVLALSSSFFIGASFIVKKKGLKKAGASGIRAGISISNPINLILLQSLKWLIFFFGYL